MSKFKIKVAEYTDSDEFIADVGVIEFDNIMTTLKGQDVNFEILYIADDKILSPVRQPLNAIY